MSLVLDDRKVSGTGPRSLGPGGSPVAVRGVSGLLIARAFCVGSGRPAARVDDRIKVEHAVKALDLE